MNYYFQADSIDTTGFDATDIAAKLYDLESEGRIKFSDSRKVKIFDENKVLFLKPYVSCFFTSTEDIMSLVINLKAAGNFSLTYWSEYMYGEIKNMEKERFQKEFDGLVFLED